MARDVGNVAKPVAIGPDEKIYVMRGSILERLTAAGWRSGDG